MCINVKLWCNGCWCLFYVVGIGWLCDGIVLINDGYLLFI